jgi:hypothetical protein
MRFNAEKKPIFWQNLAVVPAWVREVAANSIEMERS